MALLLIPFLLSQCTRIYSNKPTLDSGHTGVLASACTLCPVGVAVGYGAGGCEVEHQDRPTVVFLLSYGDPRVSLLVQGIITV